MSGLTEADRLIGHALSRALAALPNWKLSTDGVRLERTLYFQDFIQAFSFMSKAALVAERRNHHPEWTNVWNKVDIRLTTHTAGGITRTDIDFAAALDAIATSFELLCPLDPDEFCGGCR